MSSACVVWMHKIEKNACDLLEFRGFDDSYKLKEGMPLADVWPKDVEMEMNEDHPDSTLLPDSLFNIKSLIVVSDRIKNYLESRKLPGVEYLSVNIRNHKGRYTDEDYYIINLTEHVDCLDVVGSHAKKSRMTADIKKVRGIVLRDEELLAGRELFRLKSFGKATLVDKSLADDMDAQGFTGIKWGALGDFKDKTW